jgi:hypothetical protein
MLEAFIMFHVLCTTICAAALVVAFSMPQLLPSDIKDMWGSLSVFDLIKLCIIVFTLSSVLIPVAVVTLIKERNG